MADDVHRTSAAILPFRTLDKQLLQDHLPAISEESFFLLLTISQMVSAWD